VLVPYWHSSSRGIEDVISTPRWNCHLGTATERETEPKTLFLSPLSLARDLRPLSEKNRWCLFRDLFFGPGTDQLSARRRLQETSLNFVLASSMLKIRVRKLFHYHRKRMGGWRWMLPRKQIPKRSNSECATLRSHAISCVVPNRGTSFPLLGSLQRPWDLIRSPFILLNKKATSH
jgi:hypothetical protein